VAKDEDKTVLDGDLTSRHMPGHWAWCLAPDSPSPGVVPVARGRLVAGRGSAGSARGRRRGAAVPPHPGRV